MTRRDGVDDWWILLRFNDWISGDYWCWGFKGIIEERRFFHVHLIKSNDFGAEWSIIDWIDLESTSRFLNARLEWCKLPSESTKLDGGCGSSEDVDAFDYGYNRGILTCCGCDSPWKSNLIYGMVRQLWTSFHILVYDIDCSRLWTDIDSEEWYNKLTLETDTHIAVHQPQYESKALTIFDYSVSRSAVNHRGGRYRSTNWGICCKLPVQQWLILQSLSRF